MVNERDIPKFQNGYLQPSCHRIITSKQASPLTKALMARMRPKAKAPKAHKPSAKRRGKTNRLEADSKIHFVKSASANSQYF